MSEESSERYSEDSESLEARNGGFDEKENTEVVESSQESNSNLDLGFSSGKEVSVGKETSGMADAESSADDTQQMSPNVNGETESIGKEEDDGVELVSSENGGVDHQESRSLKGDRMDVSMDGGIPDYGNQNEDMFVDAPEELDRRNSDVEESMAIFKRENLEEKFDVHEAHSPVVENSIQNHQLIDELAQLRAMLDKTVEEKENLAEEYKDEREKFARELADLHQQLEGMTSQQSLLIENGNGMVDYLQKEERMDGKDDTPLHVMIRDCSKFTTFLKKALDERLQSEGTVRQLNTVISEKDQEIEELSAKLRESYQVCHEKDMHLEVTSKNLLESLAAVVKHEDLLDDSLTEKLSLVEKGTSMMVTNYSILLSEIDQLGKCLTEVRSDFVMAEVKDYGIVFDIARNELLECRKKELDIVEKLNNIEAENRKLLEQLSMEKERAEVVNAEMSKTRTDLEHEKTRCATVKEKLSMAVTKGKALVQQRDSLKHALAEKTNELDRCLLELQEKASAQEAAEDSLKHSLAEKTNELDRCLLELQEKTSAQEAAEDSLKHSLAEKTNELDRCLLELQEKASAQEAAEDSLKHLLTEKTNELDRCLLELQEKASAQEAAEDSLKHSLAEKTNELDRCLLELQEKASALEAAEVRLEELVRSQNLAVSLQESLSQKDFTLKCIEETLSEINNMPDELQSMDLTERVRWLLDQNSRLEVLSQKDLILKEIEETLSEMKMPDELQPMDIIQKARWLLDQNSRLEVLSQNDLILKEIEVTLSDELQSMDMIEKVRWLLDQKNRLEDLSQRDLILKEIEVTLSEINNMPDELQSMDMIERVRWLLDQKNRLEDLSQRDLILKEIEVTLSEINNMPDELQSMDMIERVRWLLDQKNRLDDLSQRDLILEEIEVTLSEINNMPDELQSMNMIERVRWLLDQKNRVDDLSQRDLILKEIEVTLSEINNMPEELQSMDMIEKVRWLLVQKNGLEDLSQKDLILKEIEETLSEINMPDELQSIDLIEKVKWLLDQKNRLKDLSQKDLIIKEIEETLSEINMPDELQSIDIIEKVRWLLDQKNRLEDLSQKDFILKEIEETLSEITTPDELQSMDLLERVRWLLGQKNKLEGVSLEFCKLKDVLSSIDLPETILCSSLESQINWIQESFLQARDDIIKLQNEIGGAREAISSHESELAEARNEIDRLTASLAAEKQENSTLLKRLEDLSFKHEAVAERELQIASEKDETIRMFLEALGMDNQEGGFNHSDMGMLVEKCIQKIKDQASATFESLCVEREQFEKMQSLLYIRSQESVLCEDILKGEMLERSEVTDLSNELKRVSQEITALKEENDSLLRDLERSEDKSTLLREKLSLAVKKGKGLVQEREGLKNSLAEKSKEIDNLKHELQQQVSLVAECRDQMTKLSGDLEHVPTLEADLVAMKNQRDQLEQFLLESNTMLQKVIESIESIVLPFDAVFEEPVEKVKWLAECFHDYQVGKSRSEQELETANHEISSLASKLENAYNTIQLLEDALSNTTNDLSLMAEEKEDVQVGKAFVEKELEKAKQEVGAQASKFAEVFTTLKSLEDALSLAENNISVLTEQKTAAQLDKTCAEKELEKSKEEIGSQASKLAEACITIKSLEDALSEVEKNVSKFTEEKNETEVNKKDLEKELEKVKDDAAFQASKVADAYATIRSLEDALAQAKNDLSVLVSEKEMAEQEISTLNAKLRASMEELTGTHGNVETRSVELLGHINHLQMLIKDGAMFSSLTQGFKKNLESLRQLHLLLESIQNRFVEEGSEWLQIEAGTKGEPYQANLFPSDLDNFPNGIMENNETQAADLDNISLCLTKIVEGLNMKDKLITNKFEGFSCTMDEIVAALSRALQATMGGVVSMFEHLESLKQKVTNLEAHKQDQDNTAHNLQKTVTMLLSACKNAVEELHFEVDGNSVEELQFEVDGSEYVKAAENLLLAARNVRAQTEQFENIKSASETTIQELRNELEETRITIENFIQERDLIQNRASKLEIDLEALQNFNKEMKLKLDDYHDIEDILREREAELSALRVDVATKQEERSGQFLLKDEAETLFEKLNGIEIPFRESDFKNPEHFSSAPVKKLFYIVDNVTELQHQVKPSSLETHVDEIDHLKKEAESIFSINQDLEKAKNDLAELALGMEKIIQKLGGDDLVEDKKAVSVRELFPLLEELVTDLIWESKNSKTKAQELGGKLHGHQKLVDELSAKVTALEESNHGKLPPPNTVLERSTFEGPLATGSEISEIESAGPVGRNSTSPPIPTAAHVRTLRKGSSDHLALNIDVESERLINPLEPDDDKGHAFKALNTSGLIPKQGKMIADRIDGIWVNGGRILMSRPRARIGLVAYWLVLHLWLLGTIL